MLKQLKDIKNDGNLRPIFTKILDKLEEMGPLAGKLLDSHLFIYEIKMKRPPIRLYYKHNQATNELYVFEYEMKTSVEKQQRTVEKIRRKALES
jgi:hypothetical protein